MSDRGGVRVDRENSWISTSASTIRAGGVEPVLALNDLSAGFAGATILRNISVEIPQGKVTAVLGRNGAGKTTLLRTISGLIPARTGRIRLGGRDITRLPPAKRVRLGLAHVPEGRRMVPGLTVRENLLVGGYVMSKKDLGSRYDQMLEMFPVMKKWLGWQAYNLSGGQQQLVALARALVSPSQLLLLDEPLTGLAPSVAHEILDVIRQLRADGRSILVVEQNAHMVLAVADHAFLLDQGRLDAHDQDVADGGDRLARGYLGIQR